MMTTLAVYDYVSGKVTGKTRLYYSSRLKEQTELQEMDLPHRTVDTSEH
jgi:hypothetical protein